MRLSNAPGRSTVSDGLIQVCLVYSAQAREVLDDAARALEQRRLQGVVDTECRRP